MHRLKKPTQCIEPNPTSQTVFFCSEYINLTAIAVRGGLFPSHVSLIFSGKRKPTLNVAIKVAKALDMGLEDFLEALVDHVNDLSQVA